ncbi:MAG TPA: hypothetical protein VFY14_05290 [Streptomyces sp.]|nr:hypothetical protein [Streptomyces sp.]
MTWLLIPLLTGICAVAWAVYAQRPRRSDLWQDSTRHQHLRAALSRPLPDRG